MKTQSRAENAETEPEVSEIKNGKGLAWIPSLNSWSGWRDLERASASASRTLRSIKLVHPVKSGVSAFLPGCGSKAGGNVQNAEAARGQSRRVFRRSGLVSRETAPFLFLRPRLGSRRSRSALGVATLAEQRTPVDCGTENFGRDHGRLSRRLSGNSARQPG